jgi:AbrB family looped-hinge helix DNA binding protein
MKQLFHEKLFKQDKMYGTTVVGAKGQVVIPVQARKDLKIIPGDSLVVVGKMGRALGLIKAEALSDLVELIMKNVENFGNAALKRKFKKYASEILSSVTKK